MEYRAFLRSMGIAKGFHWLDGSFMEQVEKLRDRDPEDLDIVSFLHLPPDVDQAGLAAAAPELFDREKVRRDYHLDAYVHILSDAPERLIEHGAYWSSVWAHQRDSLSWKGFVQLDLDLDDQEALKLLEAHAEGGGNTHA